MRVYVDTSVVIRVLFDDPGAVSLWGKWEEACSSRLWYTEALRVLERTRMAEHLDERTLIDMRHAIDLVHGHFMVFPVTENILVRAGESFPTVVGTLDAIHLATAILVRDSMGLDAFLTHDSQLATAARAMGFRVEGV
jgi:hypothetical protein